MPISEEPQEDAKFLVVMLGMALGRTISVSEHDKTAYMQWNGDLPEIVEAALSELDSPSMNLASPGVWVIYLLMLARAWEESPCRHTAAFLPTLRAGQARATTAEEAVIDAAIDAYCAMAVLTDDLTDAHRLVAAGAAQRMARAIDTLGNADMAYDVASVALSLAPDADPMHEELARYGLALALDADRLHQVAVCSAELAVSVLLAADRNPSRYLEAFDAAKLAVEAILQASAPIAPITAERLAPFLLARNYARTLAPPLLLLTPKIDSTQLRHELQSDRWPKRFERLPTQEWMALMKARLAAQQWEWEVEQARFILERMPDPPPLNADWTNWTIDHAAYRRAVPFLGSFLREQHFDRHFLELTHELTHVFSLLGGLGKKLACLRAAAFDAEVSMWVAEVGGPDAISQRILAEGVVPLTAGNPIALLRAEQSLELTLKTRALQDAWTPWFEGLAMFGELNADPALDIDGIGHINGCLRNLVDFEPDRTLITTSAQLHAAFEAFIAAFETRCSAAMRSLAPANLRRYLDHPDGPYLTGYLAVRSVISCWRDRTGINISATNGFDLLLHVTRFAIDDGLPDLSLPADAFALEAGRRMADWVAALTRLDNEDIETFLAPSERAGPQPNFHWEKMHLRASDADTAALAQRDEERTRMYVSQAMASLTRPDAGRRIATDDPALQMLLQACAETISDGPEGSAGADSIARQCAFVDHTIRLNSLLPIGRTQSKFFVNDLPDAARGYLGLKMLTTECAGDSGKPSSSEVWMPVSHEDADAIEAAGKRIGSPRMEVVRVIDLAGVLFDDPSLRWNHVLSLRYGDWQHLFGTNTVVRAELEDNTEQRLRAIDTIRTRLHPDGLLGAEMRYMARGTLGAQRTLAGTDPAMHWEHDGVDAAPWARHVHGLAAKVLDESYRPARQRDAGIALLRALHADQRIIDGVQQRSFSDMTAQVRQRDAIIAALLATGRNASEDPEIARLAASLAEGDLPLFAKGRAGWDVFAAH